MSLNSVHLMGRLTRDPELRRTQSGTPVATFRLAVERDFPNKETGERTADFINIVAWRQTAEFVSKYFAKGRMAVVHGHIQTREYQDKDGGKRIAFEVVAENVYFGDSKRQDKESAPPADGTYSGYGGFDEIDDRDLPF